MAQQFHTLICLNIIFLPLMDLKSLMWFYNNYSFKLSDKNYTLFSLIPLFSNPTFFYFWEVVSHHLYLLPQHHQSHLYLACLFTRHLCHLPHILPQFPLSGIMFLFIQILMILKCILSLYRGEEYLLCWKLPRFIFLESLTSS